MFIVLISLSVDTEHYTKGTGHKRNAHVKLVQHDAMIETDSVFLVWVYLFIHTLFVSLFGASLSGPWLWYNC